jgi:tetratricopeptide (TPR) repeat protein
VKQGYEASVKGKLDEAVVGPGESVEHDLQRAIRKDPANKDNYTKLADHYRREGKLQESLEWFTKGYEVSSDPSIKEQAEDVQLDMLRKNLDLARQQAAKKPDDEHLKEGSAALAKELLQQEIEVYTRRVDSHPKDLRMKFELAQRLIRVRKFPEAIKLLQQASADVRMEGPVLLTLGKVFLQQGQNSLAQRQFEKAVERFSAADTPKEFVECHYWLGRLAEDAKDPEAAERHYTEVIAVEFDYKDAHERLMKIQGSRGSGTLEGVDDM